MYDVAIIGGGITGTAAAELLSRYDLRVCLIEKETDVAEGTTKANSGIVHAGYDAPPGTRMARYNVRGSALMPGLCGRLGVLYRRTGSMVLSFSSADDDTLQQLARRGDLNGVQNLAILDADAARSREPSLSDEVRGALLAEDAAIVDPFGLAAALGESAALNGCEFLLGSPVTSIMRGRDSFEILAGGEKIRAEYILNCAGLHADSVHQMAGGGGFFIRPVRGEYYMMDRALGKLVQSVIFQCPGKNGKGVLVAPTVHGNLIVGPNAEEIEDPDDTATTAEGQAFVQASAHRLVPDIDYRYAIRNFAGVRAYSSTGDFVVEPSKDVPGFINIAGICSPGLSSAPAIAEEAARLLGQQGLRMQPKAKWTQRSIPVKIKDITLEEKQSLIEADSRYGHVICRCETITEGEIVDALHRKPVAGTVDSLKKRLGAGMGRCQGGFCAPRILEIISRETGKSPEDVLLNREGSRIIVGLLDENADDVEHHPEGERDAG